MAPGPTRALFPKRSYKHKDAGASALADSTIVGEGWEKYVGGGISSQNKVYQGPPNRLRVYHAAAGGVTRAKVTNPVTRAISPWCFSPSIRLPGPKASFCLHREKHQV